MDHHRRYNIHYFVYIQAGVIMQVAKWGNSLAVRLPVALVQELGISDGDELLLQAAPRQAQLPASVTVERQPGKLEQLQAVRKFRAAWPADFSFNRDEANAR
jgi:antitoxin MazE